MKLMVNHCPDLVQSYQHDSLEMWDQLKNKEKKVYKRIKIDSSRRDDLNIKELRETLGRTDDVCKYFCKNDHAVKNGDFIT